LARRSGRLPRSSCKDCTKPDSTDFCPSLADIGIWRLFLFASIVMARRVADVTSLRYDLLQNPAGRIRTEFEREGCMTNLIFAPRSS
jgi:hypothetical protein